MKGRTVGSILAGGLLAGLMLMSWGGLAAAQGLDSVDHYRCYRVDQHGQLPTSVVELKDQFQSGRRKVGQIRSICAPVMKRHDGKVTKVRYPKVHLVCYEISPQKNIGKDVETRNQFGRARMTVANDQTLCVPSFKKVQ